MNKVFKGKPLGNSVKYFEHVTSPPFTLNTEDKEILINPENIIKLYEQHSIERVKKATEKMREGVMDKGMQMKKTWDEYAGLELVEAAAAFSYQWLIQNYFNRISSQNISSNVKNVLTRLFNLYAVDKILDNATSFFETSVLGSLSLKAYRSIRLEILQSIRPDALAICESFGFNENVLGSALSFSDGKIYEHLLDWAKNSNDVNRADVRDVIRQETVVTMNKMR